MFANKRIYIIKLKSVLHLLFIIAIVQSCFRHTSLLYFPPPLYLNDANCMEGGGGKSCTLHTQDDISHLIVIWKKTGK